MKIGWKNTYDEYYSGLFVGHMNSVVEALLQNKKRTFHVHPTIFFQKWYEENLNKRTKSGITYEEAIQTLIKRNQLDFVGCGIVQHDEALTTFTTQINQMNFGCNYLKTRLGIQSQVVWQNDAFGHSSISPYIFNRLGFEYILLNRISENIKQDFRNQKSLEFFWHYSNQTKILASTLYKHYHTPMLDFEYRSVDIPTLATNLREDILNKAKSFRHNNYLLIWGDDFRFFESSSNFMKMETLIQYMHQHFGDEFEFQFSTISNYFQTLSHSSLPHIQSEHINFITYADQYPLDVWTGYYSTRPQLKRLIRQAESMLYMIETIHSWNIIFSQQQPLLSQIEKIRNLVYIQGHHDCITGTSTDAVAQDYKNQIIMSKFLSNNLLKSMNMMPVDITEELVSMQGNSLIIFNAKSWKRKQILQLKLEKEWKSLDCDNHKKYSILNFEKDYFVSLELNALEVIVCYLRDEELADPYQQFSNLIQVQHSHNGDVRVWIENQTVISQFLKFYPSSSAKDFLSSGPYLFRVHWFHIPLIGMLTGMVLFILLHLVLEIPYFLFRGIFALCFLYRHFDLQNKSTISKAVMTSIIFAKLMLFIGYEVIPISYFNYFMDDLMHFGIPAGIIFASLIIPFIGKRNFLLCMLIFVISTIFTYFQYPSYRSLRIPVQSFQVSKRSISGLEIFKLKQQYENFKVEHQIFFKKEEQYLDWKIILLHDDSKAPFLRKWNREMISQFHFQRPLHELFSTSSKYFVDINHFQTQQTWNNPLHFIPQHYRPITSMIKCNKTLPLIVSQSIGGTCIENNVIEIMMMRYLTEDDDRGLKFPLVNHWKEEQPMTLSLRIPFSNINNFERYQMTEEIVEPFFISYNYFNSSNIPRMKLNPNFEQYLKRNDLILLPMQTENIDKMLVISFRIFAPKIEQGIEFPFTRLRELFEGNYVPVWSLHRTDNWILSKSKFIAPNGIITEPITTFVIRKM